LRRPTPAAQPVEADAPPFKYPGGHTTLKACLAATLVGSAALKSAEHPDRLAYMMFANINTSLSYRLELTKDGALGVHGAAGGECLRGWTPGVALVPLV
jgi:hypothetical protein